MYKLMEIRDCTNDLMVTSHLTFTPNSQKKKKEMLISLMKRQLQKLFLLVWFFNQSEIKLYRFYVVTFRFVVDM